MGETKLKVVSVYLTEQEYGELKAEADDHDVTISAAIRSKIGLPRIERGAPLGNTNGKKNPGGASRPR